MKINISFEIGDRIFVDGKLKTIKGIHIYVGENGVIKKYRFHIGNSNFITINAEDVESE